MCTGCLITEKEKQELLEKVSKEAKIHAINNKTFVVVYFLEDGKPDYMEADKARAAGINPVKFVSHLQPASDG